MAFLVRVILLLAASSIAGCGGSLDQGSGSASTEASLPIEQQAIQQSSYNLFSPTEVQQGFAYFDENKIYFDNLQDNQNVVVLNKKEDFYSGDRRIIADLPNICVAQTWVRPCPLGLVFYPELHYDLNENDYFLFAYLSLDDWWFVDHAYDSTGKYYEDISLDREVLSGGAVVERVGFYLDSELIDKMSLQPISFSFRGKRGQIEYHFQPRYMQIFRQYIASAN